MNYLTEFDLLKDIVLIVYMFCATNFFKGWYEKIEKKGEIPNEAWQTNNNNNSSLCSASNRCMSLRVDVV